MNIGLRSLRTLRTTFSRTTDLPHHLRLLSFAINNNNGIGQQGTGKINNANLKWSTRNYSDISPPKHAGEKQERLKQDDEDSNIPKGKRTLPRLMDFPEIMWPSLLNSVKNWVMVNFIIRPYMDREFNIRDFAVGAKKAMQVRIHEFYSKDTTSKLILYSCKR